MSERELILCKGLNIWDSPKFQDNVVSGDISGALTSSPHNAVILGYIEHGTGQHQSNTVYSTNGISPALTTIEDGGTQQIKVLVDV